MVASFLAASVETIEFRCNYRNYNLSPLSGFRYSCDATVINSGSASSLEKLTGSHVIGKSNKDVGWLVVIRQNLTFVPEGIAEFFSNLDAFSVQSSSLKTISANDLRPFPRLVLLELFQNHLTSIDGDLFKYTPHLQFAGFRGNQIQHIGQDLVTNLNNLTWLYFDWNICIDLFATTQDAVISLAPQLSIFCPPLEVPPSECSCSEEIEDLRELNHALELQIGSLKVSSDKQNERIQQQGEDIELQSREILQLQQSNDQLVQENCAFEKRLLQIETKLRESRSLS